MTNNQIKEVITKKQAIKRINWEAYQDVNSGYTIKSYNTVIYTEANGLDLKFYSLTTSKLQKLIASCLFINDYTKSKRVKAINGVDFIKLSVK